MPLVNVSSCIRQDTIGGESHYHSTDMIRDKNDDSYLQQAPPTLPLTLTCSRVFGVLPLQLPNSLAGRLEGRAFSGAFMT